MDDCGMVVGLENADNMCQWVIAGTAGHPLLRAVLRLALRSVAGGFECAHSPHLVHQHTGPSVWTSGVREVLGLPDATSAQDIARAAWLDPTVYARARQLRLCVVAGTFWGAMSGARPQNAWNLYSSQWGEGSPNTPWLQAREQVSQQAAAAIAGRRRWSAGPLSQLG
jgi:hypothetical protein